MQVEIRRMNNDFHQSQNYQIYNEYQFINNMFFGAKKTEINKVEDTSSKDLELITKMNQEFAKSLDLKESDILPKPINIYSSSKREAEKLVQSSGIPYVFLRPRALIGRGDKVIIPRILRAHREGRLMRMGDETNLVDITPVSNVVDAIILALNAEKKAVNQIYNISNGKP